MEGKLLNIKAKHRGAINTHAAISTVLTFGVVFFMIFAIAIAASAAQNGKGETTGVGGAGYGDLGCPSSLDVALTGACIDNQLRSVMPSSPLIGYGKNFVQAGLDHGVNPAFLLAIAGNESSFGTNYNANANGKANFNYQNMKCAASQRFAPSTACDGVWGKWSSMEQSISDHAKYLKMQYFENGQTTIETIGAIYCPVSDKGCSTWPTNVTKIFQTFVGACPALKNQSMMGGLTGDVVIDPGHGNGGNTFSKAIAGASNEADHNWNIAVKIKALLDAKGIKTILTKDSAATDIEQLGLRTAVANKANAGLFISLHSDATGGGSGPRAIIDCKHSQIVEGDGSPNYTSDFSKCPTLAKTKAAHELAMAIVKNIDAKFEFNGKPEFMAGELGVLKNASMPAMIIEMFFHDNNSDLSKVDGKDDEMAKVIAETIALSFSK